MLHSLVILRRRIEHPNVNRNRFEFFASSSPINFPPHVWSMLVAKFVGNDPKFQDSPAARTSLLFVKICYQISSVSLVLYASEYFQRLRTRDELPWICQILKQFVLCPHDIWWHTREQSIYTTYKL